MRSRTDNTKQVVVYVVMRDQQANVLFAHRVYFSERRAKNYCKRMNTAEEFTDITTLIKQSFLTGNLLLPRPPGSKKLAKNRKLGTGE